MAQGEDFLSRWSRLKREEAAKPTPPPAREAKPGAVAAEGEAAPEQSLPPIDSLTLDSDYRGFLQPGVDAVLRRAALKKLFRDPRFHFDQMDKLDTYIDDYSIEDPISDEMMKTLEHARHILFDEKKPAAEDAAATTAAAAPEDVSPAAAAGAQKKNDDPRQDS